MIKNYRTGGVNSLSQILLECSFESLCEILDSAIVSHEKYICKQFAMIIEDQWKFVNAHGQEQAKTWLKKITDGLTESRDTNKLNKLNKLLYI